jgi:hypothetical protein
VKGLALTNLLVEVALAVIALAGIVASSPLLVSKARLIRERDEARKDADSLRDIVGAFQMGLGALDHLRDEVREIRAVQIVATRYVVDLMTYIRDGGSPAAIPPIPPELRDEVLEELRNRAPAVVLPAVVHPAADAPVTGA